MGLACRHAQEGSGKRIALHQHRTKSIFLGPNRDLVRRSYDVATLRLASIIALHVPGEEVLRCARRSAKYLYLCAQ